MFATIYGSLGPTWIPPLAMPPLRGFGGDGAGCRRNRKDPKCRTAKRRGAGRHIGLDAMPLDICHPTAAHTKLKLPEWYVSRSNPIIGTTNKSMAATSGR